MIKITKTRVYDTETAKLVKQVCYGAYGDPSGYEIALYRAPEGFYFLYTNGGKKSPYPEEEIAPIGKGKAAEWLEKN